MATMLETPSRIWRRIEAIENRDMPSLPSLPLFEDSAEDEEEISDDVLPADNDDGEFVEPQDSMSSPLHSTPTSTQHTISSTSRGPSSTSSTARFAQSIASRSNKSSVGPSTSRGISIRPTHHDSFEVPSLPRIHPGASRAQYADETQEGEETKSSVPDVYLPPEDEEDEGFDRDFHIADALQSISHITPPSFSSKHVSREETPKKNYDYSASLNSEPKASPFDKYRNVATRRGNPRARTPSLSRTSSSEASSPSHSTPQSNRSIPLPDSSSGSVISAMAVPLLRSRTASPAIRLTRADEEQSQSIGEISNVTHETGVRSMDITEVHASPPRLEGDDDAQEEINEFQSQHTDENLGEQSHEGREPTFSSDGEATPYAFNTKTAKPNSSGFSSPAQSLAFTPTPAFPRPRARFDLRPPPSDLLQTPARDERLDEEEPDNDDLVTPHTRRRSFLLSVINSTARPRMKFPTPHPRRLGSPGALESTPGPPSDESPSISNLQAGFAGATPRPKMPLHRRSSHPLSQEISASPGSSESGSAHATGHPTTWATPSRTSPYDGTGDRASFISTASSHDLTTHQRVNTSFDPAMGFGAGAPGHGVGRFNATKLNNYLHGLNRRLQEENENLLERLRHLEEDKKGEPSTVEVNRRLSDFSRRRSSVGTSLGNVQEEGTEGWLEEKAELEDMINAFKQEVIVCMSDREEVEKALEHERAERERDKERWKERMAEVERGVSGIISSLEQKLGVAEKRAEDTEEGASRRIKDLERDLVEIQGDRDVALERASKAERLLENGRELGTAVTEANDRIAQVMGDLRNANAQIKELEEEVMRSDARIDELERELHEDRDIIVGLEDELSSTSDALASDHAKVKQLEDTIRQLDEELNSTKAYIEELEEGASEAVGRLDVLDAELADAGETIQKLTTAEQQALQDIEALERDATKSQDVARQMEEALEEAERKMISDEAVIADLNTKLAAIERERQRETHNASEEVSRGIVEPSPTEADLQVLEAELDDANKEIARLTTLLTQSPARKAIDKAKDIKIEMLEREKEELLERNRALRLTFNEFSTPSKLVNTSGISPIHRQVLSMSFRAPRTPGGPLKDASWLHNTNTDPSLSPLVTEINRLQRELDRANESIDDKLDKLEDAGLGVVGLTKKLEDARAKITFLEDEIARLSRRDERRTRRITRARCQKCHMKLNLRHLVQADESSLEIPGDDLADEPPTPPTRTSEALKANLQTINGHLDELKTQWEVEKKRLLGEKDVLENAANRLNGEVKNTREEAKRLAETTRAGDKARANAQNELDKAKRTISVLETELGTERSRLRTMVTEQDRMQRDRKQIELDLQRTGSDMNEVKEQLQRLKKDNRNLEKELRENVNAEQRARLLETKVAGNTETIDQLREERSLLATNHKDLQRRFAEISETANHLRKEYAAHSTSHENRRQELDLHRLEVDELRQALESKSNDLRRVESEKERIATEKTDVARTVAALEADLKRVRKDAEAFGRDLKLLQSEKEKLEGRSKDEISKAERDRKQAQTQIRLLNEQLEAQKENTIRAREEIKSHVCAADERQISKMKLQHNKECKGLIVQIRYLKAKFLRETTFRSDLVYQKDYLLVLLSQFEKSEKTIIASIARIGFPVAPPTRQKQARNLKGVAQMVVFLVRVRRFSANWGEQSAAKQAVVAALEDVHRKRVG